MAECGLAPRTPYRSNSTPWESECGNCHQVTWPTLSSAQKAIRQGQPKCCDLCRRSGAIRPQVAEDLLRRASGEPLVPFPGVKAKWPSRCLNTACRREIAPWFESIKYAGTGACVFCGGYGIRSNDQAQVYLMQHEGHAAAKIGNAKDGSRRIILHQTQLWEIRALHPDEALTRIMVRSARLDGAWSVWPSTAAEAGQLIDAELPTEQAVTAPFTVNAAAQAADARHTTAHLAPDRIGRHLAERCNLPPDAGRQVRDAAARDRAFRDFSGAVEVARAFYLGERAADTSSSPDTGSPAADDSART